MGYTKTLLLSALLVASIGATWTNVSSIVAQADHAEAAGIPANGVPEGSGETVETPSGDAPEDPAEAPAIAAREGDETAEAPTSDPHDGHEETVVEMAVATSDGMVSVFITAIGPDTLAGQEAIREEFLNQNPGVSEVGVVASYVLTSVVREPQVTMSYNGAGAPSAAAAPRQLVVDGLLGWNNVTPAFQFEYGGATSASSHICGGDARDGVNLIKWGPQEGGILAMACWAWPTETLPSECDIVVDPDHDWVNEHDLRGVVLHEAGHCAGLGHSDDPNAVMRDSRRALTQDDIDGLCAIYGCSERPEFRVTVPAMARN